MRKSTNIDPWWPPSNEVSDCHARVTNHRFTRLQEKEREENILRSRAQEVHYKLRACEEMLHGVIEGIADDQILVRFTHIDPSDLDREFSIVIDVSSKTYKGESNRDRPSRQLTPPQFRQVHRSYPLFPSWLMNLTGQETSITLLNRSGKPLMNLRSNDDRQAPFLALYTISCGQCQVES